MNGIKLMPHAIDRYCERVKPHLDQVEARAELERLIEMASDWAAREDCTTDYDDADHLLELAPGIWLVVNETKGLFYGNTLLTNAGFSDRTRERRNERKAYKRKAHKARNRKGGKGGRGGRPEHRFDIEAA